MIQISSIFLNVRKKLLYIPFLTALVSVMGGCKSNCSHQVLDINLSSPDSNTLKVQVLVHTKQEADISVKYWLAENEKKQFISTVSEHSQIHKINLTNLQWDKEYKYSIVTGIDNCAAESRIYAFTTPARPVWMKNLFSVTVPDSTSLPFLFRQAYLMLYSRESPGVLYILNSKGEVVWYHQAKGTGFKTAHFTGNNTILCIMGSKEYEASYGNEILELSLAGDTLFHIRKGEKGLTQTIHHEVILNDKDQIVTICSEDRIIDLTPVGGTKADTVKSDGILVLDRKGRQVWKWSVFDTLNPLLDKNIIKDKKDWMHANSLSYDADGNYLISFYNIGQVWKIDSKNGKVIWKFGKGGDFKIAPEARFDNSHAVHINQQNCLMLFDNGTSKKISRSMAFQLNEKEKKATLLINTPLPEVLFTERMGSSYLVDDSCLLVTSGKKNTVVLSNLKGRFLWALNTGFILYRTELIFPDRVRPYLMN